MEYEPSVVLIVVVILCFAVVSISMDNTKKHDLLINVCQVEGYEYVDLSVPVKEGYIACCNETYVNNVRVEDVCVGVKQ